MSRTQGDHYDCARRRAQYMGFWGRFSFNFEEVSSFVVVLRPRQPYGHDHQVLEVPELYKTKREGDISTLHAKINPSLDL